MCILLKFNYAKFGVPNLFFSKVIEEKPLGGLLDTPFGQEGLKAHCRPYLFQEALILYQGYISLRHNKSIQVESHI